MRRSNVVASGVALAAVVFTGIALHGWNRGPMLRPEVSARIAVAAAKAGAATINLSEATTFSWTDLYIIPPYSTKEGAVRRMGVSWPWRWHQIEYRDGISLLVFVDSSRITGIVEHPRGKGDFVIDDTIQHFAKTDAVFTAIRREDDWVLFKPARIASR